MSFGKRYAAKELGVLEHKGAWDASTNSPALMSSTGDKGDYYIVSVAGSTNLDGIIDWQPGDWVLFSGTEWQKLDNSEITEVVNSTSGNETDKAPSVSAIKLYIDAADQLLDTRLDNIETNLTTSIVSVFENNAAIYADARPPMVDPNYRDGWYFKNQGPVNTAQNKINWYFYDGQLENITLGNFSAYTIVTFDSLTSKPHLAFYTFPGTSGNAATWYRSRVIYIPDGTPSVGVKYLMYFGQDPKVHPELPRLPMVIASNSAGPRASSERVLTAALGSDSATAVNNCQFIAESIGVYSPTIRRKINLKMRPSLLSQTVKETVYTSAINSTSLTTFVDISGLTSSNLAPGLYQFTFKALANSASTETGIGVRLVAKTATVSTVYAKYSITQETSGTTQSYQYDQTSQNSTTTSTSVPSGVGFVIQGEGVVRITSTGSVVMQFKSEVQDSSVSINPDSILTLEKL